jgi:hypothetical protein
MDIFILSWRDYALIALIVWAICRSMFSQLRSDIRDDLALMATALARIARERQALDDYVGQEGARTREESNRTPTTECDATRGAQVNAMFVRASRSNILVERGTEQKGTPPGEPVDQG